MGRVNNYIASTWEKYMWPNQQIYDHHKRKLVHIHGRIQIEQFFPLASIEFEHRDWDDEQTSLFFCCCQYPRIVDKQTNNFLISCLLDYVLDFKIN